MPARIALLAAEAALFIFLSVAGIRLGSRRSERANTALTATELSVSSAAAFLALVGGSGFFATPLWGLAGPLLVITVVRGGTVIPYLCCAAAGASAVLAGTTLSSWGVNGLAAAQAVVGPAPLIRQGWWSLGLFGLAVAAIYGWSITLPAPSPSVADRSVAAAEVAAGASLVAVMVGPALLGFAEAPAAGARHSLASIGVALMLCLTCGFLRSKAAPRDTAASSKTEGPSLEVPT